MHLFPATCPKIIFLKKHRKTNKTTIEAIKQHYNSFTYTRYYLEKTPLE